MKKVMLTLAATVVMLSNSAYAVFLDNSEQCKAQSNDIAQGIEYKELNAIDQKLGEAAAAINAMDNEPAAFVVDVTAGTAVRYAQTTVDVAQDGAEYIQKFATYAADTPACAARSGKWAGVFDCFAQLPNKVVTLTFAKSADVASNIVVGVYSLGSGVLKAAEQFSMSIAQGLQSYKNPVTDVVSVPFVIVGVTLQATDYVAEVILVDTIGGGLMVAKNAIFDAGANTCDLLRSLNPFRFRPVRAVGYAAETAADLAIDALKLAKHLGTLGGNLKPGDSAGGNSDYEAGRGR